MNDGEGLVNLSERDMVGPKINVANLQLRIGLRTPRPSKRGYIGRSPRRPGPRTRVFLRVVKSTKSTKSFSLFISFCKMAYLVVCAC